MKILQINTTINTTSTGRIAEEIGQKFIEGGHESYIAGSRIGPNASESEIIKVGNKLDVYLHGIKTRLFDRHGFGSKSATQNLVDRIKKIDPDVIGLHNLHGYYLNIETLFKYLKKVQKPVVWTLFDCWAFTGHCTYFDRANCEKWKTHCHECPLTQYYPKSLFIDNSPKNFEQKKKIFNGLDNLTLVTHSKWLKNHVEQSFLQSYPVKMIHNGVNLHKFGIVENVSRDKLFDPDKKLILGVANTWSERKGLNDFIKLRKQLSYSYKIVLIGLDSNQIKNMPRGIEGITRTEDIEELVKWYNMADVFVNPTMADNFPTTNLEALACGTPVVTYDTGGSPEAIDENTGKVVGKGDITALADAVRELASEDRQQISAACRKRAEDNFNKDERYQVYLDLYKQLAQR